MKHLSLLILFCLFCAVTGCADLTSSLSPEKPELRKGAPVVYIHPLTASHGQASLGILPFQMPANMNIEQGIGVGTLYKDVFLGKRTFQRVKQINNPYRELEEAAQLGRNAKVDLVMAGRINYAIEGTELGGARVDVSMRLLDSGSGNTVWYIEQTMDQPVDYPDVGILNHVMTTFSSNHIRKPSEAPTLPNMLVQIASDMADVIAGAKYVRK